MSKSKKARFTRDGKLWKDTVFASRCQAQARSKRKQRRSQQERTRDKAKLRDEVQLQVGPVTDQGPTLSSVGHAMAGAVAIQMKSKPSPLGLYTEARQIERNK